MKNKCIWVLFIIFLGAPCYGMGLQEIIHTVSYKQTFEDAVYVRTSQKYVFADVYHFDLDEKGKFVVQRNEPFQETWITIPHMTAQQSTWSDSLFIPYQIRLTDSLRGEYLAYIVFSASNTPNKKDAKPIGIEIPLFVRVQEKMEFNAQISSIHYAPDTQLVTITVQNNSDTFMVPDIEIKIFTVYTIDDVAEKKLIFSGSLEKRAMILSQKEREYLFKMSLNSGQYQFEFNFQLDNIYLNEPDKKIVVDLTI